MPETVTNASKAINTARSFFAAYDSHDVDKMVAACNENAKLRYMPMGSQGRGKVRELGKAIWASFIDALPDLHVTVQSMFGDASNIAAEVMIGGGTQRKDLVYGQVRIPSQGSTTSCRMYSCCKRTKAGLSRKSLPIGIMPASTRSWARKRWTEPNSWAGFTRRQGG